MKLLHNKTINSAIWYTISSVLAKGISLLLTPVFTRILTKSEFGYYSSFVSWQNILVTVFSLELASTVLRARFDYDNKSFKDYVFSVSAFGIGFSVIAASISGLIVYLTGSNVLGIDNKYLVSLGLVIVFSPMIQIFQAEQRAEVKYKLSSAATLAFSLMSFLVPLVMTRLMDNKLDALIDGIAINAIIWGVILFLYYVVKSSKKIKKEYIKYALIISLPIIPHIVSANIMGNSDKLMINSMSGPEYAALYGVVYTCAMAVTLLRNALNNAWIPWFYKKMGEEEYKTIRGISDKYIIFFSLGTLLVCLFGPELVQILGGKAYSEAKYLVPIIMLGCYYNFLNLFYVNIEFYQKKTHMISIITIIATVLNLGMNYVGIKMFGYEAAAYTTAICNLLIVVLHYISTRNMNNAEVCNNKLVFLCSGVGVVICIGCRYLYDLDIGRFITIGIVGIVSVYVCLRMVKRIHNED